MNEVQKKDEIIDSPIDTIEEVDPLDENETDIEIIKAHALDVEDRNRKLFARTKKAEGFELKDGKWIKKTESKPEDKKPDATIEQPSELSQVDVITLAKSDIADEDIPDVIEYANFKKISIAEALKTDVVKTILAEKVESRKIANGTNTGGSRRGNAKVSDDALLENARNGVYPDSEADIARLSRLKLGIK